MSKNVAISDFLNDAERYKKLKRQAFILNGARAVFAALLIIGLVCFAVWTIDYSYHRVVDLFAAGKKENKNWIALYSMAGIFAAVFLVFFLTAFFKRQAVPNQYIVTRKAAPLLWSNIDAICGAVSTAPPDMLLITPDMNAFATEVAEKGILRKRTRIVGLGYPLLRLLKTEQAAAVITHEISHLKSADTLADQLMEFMHNMTPDENDNSVMILGNFVYFSGIIVKTVLFPFLLPLVLLTAKASRLAEYRSDALAAHLFGEKAAAEALIALHVYGENFETELWKPMIDAWQAGNAIPISPFAEVVTSSQTESERAKAALWLEETLDRQTGWLDTHPCLRERLLSLGVEATLPEFAEHLSAAQLLFGDRHEVVRDGLERLILDDAKSAFEKRREDVEKTTALIEQVRPLIPHAADPYQAAEVVSLLLERSIAPKHSLPIHKDLVARWGKIPSSVSELCFHRLADEDPSALDDLLSLLESDSIMIGEVRTFFRELLWSKDESQRSMHWMKAWLDTDNKVGRIESALEALEERLASDSRKCVQSEVLAPHGLEDWHIAMIVDEILALDADINTIKLARIVPSGEKTPAQFALYVMNKNDDVFTDHLSCIRNRLCLPHNSQVFLGTTFDVPTIKPLRELRKSRDHYIYEIKETDRAA